MVALAVRAWFFRLLSVLKVSISIGLKISILVTLACNVWWLVELPPCRMLKFNRKSCGGILPNHAISRFYSCLA
jgi:hypothetical protein